MTIAVIAQARAGSVRLPGKVLKKIGDDTVLSRVIRRARAIAGVDVVCVATSSLAGDDPVAREAERCGAAVFRGDERDVVARPVVAVRDAPIQRAVRRGYAVIMPSGQQVQRMWADLNEWLDGNVEAREAPPALLGLDDWSWQPRTAQAR